MPSNFSRSCHVRASDVRASHVRASRARSRYEKVALFLLCLSLTSQVSVSVVPHLLAKKKDPAADAGENEQKRAMQALNRLAFGPRPGDIQQVMAMGVDRWIDLQLHPEKISDQAVETRLDQFRTLRMSSKEIVEDFPDNQIIKQVIDGKRPMPSDPARRAVYQVQIARYQEKQEKKKEDRKQEAAVAAPVPAGPAASETAKTEAELAAAAAASPDAVPATADGNGMSSTSMNTTAGSGGARSSEM